jgi:hypothetical protein
MLKAYLIDRNCEGEKPKLMVEWPYTYPETGLTDNYTAVVQSNYIHL